MMRTQRQATAAELLYVSNALETFVWGCGEARLHYRAFEAGVVPGSIPKNSQQPRRL
jgi:hypothetical protein